jgi:hypothetical protein
LGCAAIAAALCLMNGRASAQTVLQDDFEADWDYSGGAVPPGGIWTGTWNHTVSGPPFNTTTNDGQLTIHDSLNPTGHGWEIDQSDAEFLFVQLPAGSATTNNNPGGLEFSATVKLTAQNNGNWSWAGIVARQAQGDGPGGPGSAEHANENFYTFGSFLAAVPPGAPDIGSWLRKRVTSGAQAESSGDFLTPDDPGHALPLWFRMERRRDATDLTRVRYHFLMSTDGNTFTQVNSNLAPVGSPFHDNSIPMQVGLSFGFFNNGTNNMTTFPPEEPGGEPGPAIYPNGANAVFDDFRIEYVPEPATVAMSVMAILALAGLGARRRRS